MDETIIYKPRRHDMASLVQLNIGCRKITRYVLYARVKKGRAAALLCGGLGSRSVSVLDQAGKEEQEKMDDEGGGRMENSYAKTRPVG
jgi:hypothetical protein